MNRAGKYEIQIVTLLLAGFFCLFLSGGDVFAKDVDEDELEYQNNRVARIAFVRGDVQIRRADDQDWEDATVNLPFVEGDRIATGENAVVEIQFDRDNYLRLKADSILKIVTLSNNGVAVSLPEGALSLRVGRFKKNREFFEIDAPRTTVAIEQEGLYRVTAPGGETGGNELFVTVKEAGEARVYTETSAYTVRNNRTARVFLDGAYAGDSDFSAAYGRDDFDDWVAAREDQLQRRRRSDADNYYDPAIFGTDDFNDSGEWINTAHRESAHRLRGRPACSLNDC